jgi:fibronectin type 3 domain-containing protein
MGTGDTYSVYDGPQSGGPYTLVASGIPAMAWTDMSVKAGTTYYYVVTETVGGAESAFSNEAQAVIPTP